MKLNRVTITGADETVSIEDLAKLSEKYPFVEWGILFSEKKQGLDPRYPSIQWIKGLLNKSLVNHDHTMNLSAHICGSYTQMILKGDKESFIKTKLYNPCVLFKRSQLNFKLYNVELKEEELKEMLINNFPAQEVIFQLRKDENDNLFYRLENFFNKNYKEYKNVKIAGLYDKSEGTGLTMTDYPIFNSIYGTNFGYAGGITPDNIEEIIKTLNALPSDNNYWIDLETGARTIEKKQNYDGSELVIKDYFDLDKVVKCLKIAEKYIR